MQLEVMILLTRVLTVAHAMAANASLASIFLAVNYHIEGMLIWCISR